MKTAMQGFFDIRRTIGMRENPETALSHLISVIYDHYAE